MADDVLTFEELRRVQSGERDSDTLQELDEAFFDRARNYLELKQDGDDHLKNQEYRNAKNILQDVMDLRQKKIVKLAFLSIKSNVNVENLLPHEEELFEEIENAIGAYRHDRNEDVFERLDGRSGAGGTATEPEEPKPISEEEESGGSAEEAAVEEEESKKEISDPGEDEDDQDEGDGVEEETGEEGETEDDSDDGGEEDEGSSVDDILEFDTGEDEEEDEGEDDTVIEAPEDEPEEKPEEETGSGSEPGDGKVQVRVQERIPEFMGTDLNAYGPFEEGEEVAVPEENAAVLEEQGKAERV